MQELAEDIGGFDLEATLRRNALTVNQKPMSRQDQSRTWRRWEVLQSGMDLVAEGEARMRAARALAPEKTYNNEEVSFLVREQRRRRG